MITLRPHHVVRFQGYFLTGKLIEEENFDYQKESSLYQRIKEDPNEQIQIVDGLDDICAFCTKPGKPDDSCRVPSSKEWFSDLDMAKSYNLEIGRVYGRDDFLKTIQETKMWKIGEMAHPFLLSLGY